MSINVTRSQFIKSAAAGAAAAGVLGAASAIADEASYNYEADVIVVGAGGAGVMACVTAAQEGAKVLAFEKSFYTGGDSRLSEQDVLAFWPEHTLKDIGVEDNYDEYLKDWRDTHEFSSVKGLRGDALPDETPFAERFMQTWPEVGKFLEEDRGIEFKPFFSGQSLATLNTFEPRTFRGQSNITDTVTDYLETLDNVEIVYNTEITALLQDESGRVIGVRGLDQQGLIFTAKANKGVILSTGTFNANPGMVSMYISPIYAKCLPGGCSTVTGDGQKMVAAIGGKLTDMDLGLNWFNPPVGFKIKQLLVHDHQEGFGHGDAYEYPADPAIVVNFEGKRFYNEHLGYNGMAREGAMQTHQLCFYINDAKMDSTWATDGCDAVLFGDTLEELAEKLCIPADTFVAEVERYNQFVANGVDEDFGKDLSEVWAIDTPPYYALVMTGRHYVTLGGIATDVDSHVLMADGSVIPGLYAAGVCCGSYWEQEGLLYYGGLNQALVYGWQAGRFAAQGK